MYVLMEGLLVLNMYFAGTKTDRALKPFISTTIVAILFAPMERKGL